jgi:hypothetical protein
MKLSSSFGEYPTTGSVSPDDNDPPEGDDNDPPEGVTYPPTDRRFLAPGDENLKCPINSQSPLDSMLKFLYNATKWNEPSYETK